MITSIQTKEVLRLLGLMIQAGQKEKQWTSADLADRAGISRNTLAKAKNGDPTVAAGTLFECARLVGVDLLGDKDQRRIETLRIQGTLDLLPRRVRASTGDEDDF